MPFDPPGRPGLLARVRGLFGARPRRPKAVGGEGHRGVAFGDVGDGKEDVSDENRRKWKRLYGDDVAGFVYEGGILFVHSTNVAAAQYFRGAKKLMLEYLNGSAYLYDGVSEDEALGFATTQSKGSWCWDFLRVRGKGNAKKTKKPFTQIK